MDGVVILEYFLMHIYKGADPKLNELLWISLSVFVFLCVIYDRYRRRCNELTFIKLSLVHPLAPSHTPPPSRVLLSLTSPLPSCLTLHFYPPFAEEVSLAEQVRRIKEIEAIESDSFVPQAFKSSRDAAKVRSSLPPSPTVFPLPLSVSRFSFASHLLPHRCD